jgi:GntR family transcriptional regulator
MRLLAEKWTSPRTLHLSCSAPRVRTDVPKKPLDMACVYQYHNTLMHEAAFRFSVHPSSGLPIYRQIMDQVRALVAGGRIEPGELLPSVRQLAAELQVNMMTVSKAYARLEAEGVIERVRGTGMRVRPSAVAGSVADRRRELRPAVEQAVVRARQLQLSDQQVLDVVQSVLKEHRP